MDCEARDRPDAAHPVMQVTCGVLENFREAYLVAARTLTAEKTWPIEQKGLLERMKQQYETSLLLGEVTKPEGGAVVTFGNALARFAELGHVTIARPDDSRERSRSATVRSFRCSTRTPASTGSRVRSGCRRTHS